MHDDTTGEANPYESPKDFEIPRQPGFIAIVVVVVATIVSSVCTFFCTCFGIGLATIGILEEAAIPLALIGGLVAAVFVGFFVLRIAYRFFTPRPDPPKLPSPEERLKQ